jgi:hypothetical protein
LKKFLLASCSALALLGAAALVGVPRANAQAASTWNTCADHGGWCFFAGATNVRYGANGVFNQKLIPAGQGGTACNQIVFGDPLPGVVKHCELEVLPLASKEINIGSSEYSNIIKFDLAGTHGVPYANPSGASVGQPCGSLDVPPWRNLQQLTGFRDEVRAKKYIASWDQVYNACDGPNSRVLVANARIELSKLSTYVFFWSQNKWVEVENKGIWGLAYAEDFANDESVNADMIDGSRAEYKLVRSGIWNASPSAYGGPGSRNPRMIQRSENDVGYNFHGYGSRNAINWADVRAVVVTQAMRCVPTSGTDLTDCNKLKYIAGVGVDSFLNLTGGADLGNTQEAVGFGRLKPVTTSWQFFTNYVGPTDFAGVGVPPIPEI